MNFAVFRAVPWRLVASSGFVEDVLELLAKEPQYMEEAAKLYVRFMGAAASPEFSNGAVVAAAVMLLSTMYYFWVVEQPDDSIEKAAVLAACQKLDEIAQKEEVGSGDKNGLH